METEIRMNDFPLEKLLNIHAADAVQLLVQLGQIYISQFADENDIPTRAVLTLRLEAF